MDFIKDFIKLQECVDDINKAEKETKGSDSIKELKKLKGQFDKSKKEYLKGKKEINKNQDNYKKLMKDLRELNAEVSKKEDTLYNNSGNDLKLIEKLQSSIEKGKEQLESIKTQEEDILKVEEETKSKVEEVAKELVSINKKFTEIKENMNKESKKSKRKINSAKKKYEEAKKSMDEDKVELFERVSQNIKPPIARIEEDICMGCRMHVSKITYTNVERGKGIVYCDNCGRILYKD